MQSKRENRKFRIFKEFQMNKIAIDLTELDMSILENIYMIVNLRNKVENPESDPFYLISKDDKLYFSDNYNSNQILFKIDEWIEMFPSFISNKSPKTNDLELFLKGYIAIKLENSSEWNSLVQILQDKNISYKKPVIYNNYYFVKNNKLVSSFTSFLPKVNIINLN